MPAIKPVVIERKPCFTDVVRDENKYLRDYLTHEAYKFDDFSEPLKHLCCEYIPHYHPTPEALGKARAKYQADKAHYLATGEIPSD